MVKTLCERKLSKKGVSNVNIKKICSVGAKRRYSTLKKIPITLLDIAMKSMRKKGQLGKGQVLIQSLVTGDTAIVRRTQIGKITTKVPDMLKKK